MASCLAMGTNSFSFPSPPSPSLVAAIPTTCFRVTGNPPAPPLLRCSFTSPLSSSFFSGTSLGLDLKSGVRTPAGGIRRWRRRGLVIRAVKYVLCQTKRNRSRKSLARTHGFRKRMSTTKGRQVIKRRRAKGRRILCTKTNPISGKGA